MVIANSSQKRRRRVTVGKAATLGGGGRALKLLHLLGGEKKTPRPKGEIIIFCKPRNKHANNFDRIEIFYRGIYNNKR